MGSASNYLNLNDNARFCGSPMASINLACPRCQSAQLYRHGHERFRCRDCHRVFQLTYAYEARKPKVKEQIIERA